MKQLMFSRCAMCGKYISGNLHGSVRVVNVIVRQFLAVQLLFVGKCRTHRAGSGSPEPA